jgi:hypothetical protein
LLDQRADATAVHVGDVVDVQHEPSAMSPEMPENQSKYSTRLTGARPS